MNPNHVPRVPTTPIRRSKWEHLAEIDRRFGRRRAELHAATEAHANTAQPQLIAPDVAQAAPSLWWGVALAAVAVACAIAFSIVAQ